MAKRDRGHGVARDDEMAHAELGEKAGRLPREATHGRVGLGPVRYARGVAEVDDVPGRQETPQVAHHGEAADARIEDAEGVFATASGAVTAGGAATAGVAATAGGATPTPPLHRQ